MAADEELESTGEPIGDQEDSQNSNAQQTTTSYAQAAATNTQSGSASDEDFDDLEGEVDPSVARKILIKKVIKFSVLIAISSLLAYKLFIQDDSIQEEEAPRNASTRSRSAADYIPSNAGGGNVISKEEAKNIIKTASPPPPPKPVIKPPTLEAPELPPLPNFDAFNQPSNVNVSPGGTVGVPVQGQGVPVADGSEISEDQKRKLSMFVINGGTNTPNSTDPAKKKSDFIIMDGSGLSPKVVSEKISTNIVANLESSLVQGKMIDAVLETAINSELPGIVRAIVSNDVFGETGNKILIPRGSRLFGSYSNTILRGQSRINISWTRIVRPDGVTISINAQATDQFGRAGVEGDVDNRFGESLTNSLFVTFAGLGAAIALEKISGGQGQSQIVSPNGTFTTTGIKPTNIAAQAAIQQISNMTNKIFQGGNLNPIVVLPQGTKLKVMVAQDLVIPHYRRIAIP